MTLPVLILALVVLIVIYALDDNPHSWANRDKPMRKQLSEPLRPDRRPLAQCQMMRATPRPARVSRA